MLIFWVTASALAAGAAALIAWSAARSGRSSASEAASTGVYRRQLAEIRDLGVRGLISPDELRSAEAEAGRRLLADADAVRRPWRRGGQSARSAVLLAGVAGAAGAIGLYAVVGAPGLGDQPFRARLAAWRQSDPAQLSPEQMVAVLADVARQRPRDPTVQEYLGRARLAAGDAALSAQAFARASQLSPRSANLHAELGEALTLGADGKVTPEAEAAFQRALALDTSNAASRYFLGRARLASKDPSGALALWRPLERELPADDPRLPALRAEVAKAEGRPVLSAPTLDAETRALAQGMVARLATRLKAEPADPEGWARLVRAYGVLGDRAAQSSALQQARKLYATQPETLARIEAEASDGPR